MSENKKSLLLKNGREDFLIKMNVVNDEENKKIFKGGCLLSKGSAKIFIAL